MLYTVKVAAPRRVGVSPGEIRSTAIVFRFPPFGFNQSILPASQFDNKTCDEFVPMDPLWRIKFETVYAFLDFVQIQMKCKCDGVLNFYPLRRV